MQGNLANPMSTQTPTFKWLFTHSDPSGLASLRYQDAKEEDQLLGHSASAGDPWLASSGLEVEA